MKNFLLTSSTIGILIFGAVFSATFLSTGYIESSARSFIVSRIEKEIKEKKVAGVNLNDVGEKLGWLKDKYADQIASAQKQMSGGIRIKIEDMLARICDVRCLQDKGIQLEDVTESALQEKIAQLKDVSEKLSEMIKGKYYGIIGNLLTDLRIFSGVNLILFVLIAGTMMKGPSVTKPLILPAGLLFASTIVSTSIYIWGQNWFYTILFNNYMGYGYAAYVGVIFAFLLDIVFNSAHITTSIVDGILSWYIDIMSCFSS
jgi:hypothetical protein